MHHKRAISSTRLLIVGLFDSLRVVEAACALLSTISPAITWWTSPLPPIFGGTSINFLFINVVCTYNVLFFYHLEHFRSNYCSVHLDANNSSDWFLYDDVKAACKSCFITMLRIGSSSVHSVWNDRSWPIYRAFVADSGKGKCLRNTVSSDPRLAELWLSAAEAVQRVLRNNVIPGLQYWIPQKPNRLIDFWRSVSCDGLDSIRPLHMLPASTTVSFCLSNTNQSNACNDDWNCSITEINHRYSYITTGRSRSKQYFVRCVPSLPY